MMSQIGVGFIGCGGIHRAHAPHIVEHPDAFIACAMDVNEEAVEKHQEQYGTDCGTTELEDLLGHDEVDAVVVCTPTGFHPHGVIAAAQAGKHIFCEKPMAMTVAEAEEMAQACEENGVILQIGFVRHFCNEWLKLREIIRDGIIGRPVVWRSVSAGSGAPTPWFFDRTIGGGPFIDGAVHNYDFARFTFGEATRVCANLRHMKTTGDALDTGVATVDFADGDQLIMCWSWGLPGHGSDVRAQGAHDVLGPEGAIVFPGEGTLEVRRPGGEEIVEYQPDTGSDWFRRQMAHFIDCVTSGSRPDVGAREGIEATRIAEAILNIGGQPGVTEL
ncbi:MAG: Gfo/Idh/MocA family oxidoreductase [Armatimonadota bacterium]|nr:Gfo/Idh/MocA family oxidoreductase [Armatimonadota bacterium]